MSVIMRGSKEGQVLGGTVGVTWGTAGRRMLRPDRNRNDCSAVLTLTTQPGAFWVHPITRSVLMMPVSVSIDRSRTLFCVAVSVARAKKRGKASARRPPPKIDKGRDERQKRWMVRREKTYSTERTCADWGFGYFLQMPMLTSDHGCLYSADAHLVSDKTRQI